MKSERDAFEQDSTLVWGNDLKGRQLEQMMVDYGDEVLAVAYFYLRDRQMAEDAAQDVFLKVYQNLDSFRGESSTRTWIYRIAVNLCKDRLRSWNYRRVVPLAENWDPAGEDATEREALLHLEAGEILKAVFGLPAKYREAVVLKHYSGFSVAEIAHLCDLSSGNVRVRLHRAYKMLENKLKEAPGDE